MGRSGTIERIIATTLGVTLVQVPVAVSSAAAASVEPEATSEEAPDPVLEEVQALYVEGATKYSAADYAGAIETFTEALGLLNRSNAEFPPEARGRLLFNLATAHERSYKLDLDPVHLRKAAEIFGRVVDEAASQGYGDDLVEQCREARERIEALIARLEEREQEQEQEGEEITPPPATSRGPDDTVQQNPGRGLLIAGGVVTGLGVASSGLLIAGLVIGRNARNDLDRFRLPSAEEMRIDTIDRGRRGNNLAIAGGVLTGVLVITGTALLVAGAVRRKKAGSRIACAPAFGPAGAYLGCGVRL